MELIFTPSPPPSEIGFRLPSPKIEIPENPPTLFQIQSPFAKTEYCILFLCKMFIIYKYLLL